MPVREKVLQLLIDADDAAFKRLMEEECEESAMELIANYLVDHGVTVQDGEDNNVPTQWISVKDRLPTPYKNVIVCRESFYGGGKFVGTDYLTVQPLEKTSVWCGDYNTWKSGVTHWMPLPEPPERKKGGGR